MDETENCGKHRIMDIRDAHPKCASCLDWDKERSRCENVYSPCTFVMRQDYCRFHSAFKRPHQPTTTPKEPQ